MKSELYRPLAMIACGGGLLVLTAVGLFEQWRDDITAFVIIALTQGAIYLLALRLAWRGQMPRHFLVLIFCLAALMRLLVLWSPPYLSSDIYRYVWDGRVTGSGINPYRYIPVDPALDTLRDEAIFPEINRNNYARTIYPPGAETIFLIVTRFGQSVMAMKGAMLVFEALAVLLMLRLLNLSAHPPERILAYAWHPLPLWEFAGSGHVDAAVIALVALALWAGRRDFPALTGVALAGAALIKFIPVVIAPALYRRWDWKLPMAFAAAFVIAYLPFLGVGWNVLGFLPNYAQEEGYNRGGGYYFWSLAQAVLPLDGVGALPYTLLALAALAALSFWVMLRSRNEARMIDDAALMATAFTVLLSPHYPWYFAWLVTFGCFACYPPLLYLTVTSFLLYLVPVGSMIVADTRRLVVESAIYGPFVVLALVDLWRRRRGADA